MESDVVPQLTEIVRNNANEAACAWLNQCMSQLDNKVFDIDNLAMFLSMAKRKIGKNTVNGQTTISHENIDFTIGSWLVSDVARTIFLLVSARTQLDEFPNIVHKVYRMGDEFERAAITRGLMLLPKAHLCKDLALETGRTNSVSLFSALALHNPYPAGYYTEKEFNSLVLKSLFLQIKIELIFGLKERTNPILSEMCEDYIDERDAAGRAIPSDIILALAPYATSRGNKYLQLSLRHGTAKQRHYAEIAATWSSKPKSATDK